jgi:endonuclease-3
VNKRAKFIERIYRLLQLEYGHPNCKGGEDPLSELIATILSQNTSDRNSHRAFRNLKGRFPSWEEVRKASLEEIAEAIKVGGLSQQKAKRIKSLLEKIHQQVGKLDLSFLKEMDGNAVKGYLLRFKGVGQKTAACVLLFSLGKPSMPVDTHILRVSKRIGLVPQMSSAVQAQVILEGITPPQLIHPLHLNLIEHGRRVCKARLPLCAGCILRNECDYPEKMN